MSLKGKSWFRTVPAGEDTVATACARGEPSLYEVLLIFAVVFGLHLLTVCRVKNFWDLAAGCDDNGPYLEIAAIVRNWHFPGGATPFHFWGLPYAVAGVSKLFSIPELMALVMVSILGSVAACVLVHRLYGGWVAAVFIFVDYYWIQFSIEGGSEPLFVCLLYASFLAARSSRWNLAALLASLSTTVRPVGLFALVCFAAVLAMRRSYRQLAVITLIGLGIGILYLAPVWILVGSPFVNLVGYREFWGAHGWPLTYPFGALVPGYLLLLDNAARWPVLVMFVASLELALVGTVAVWLPRNRQRFSLYQPEALFASIYTVFLISYNDYLDISGGLPRFLIPVVPLLVFSLRDCIPHDRRALWGGAVLSALLSSAALVGFKSVFGFRLP
jgi:hypothetical protein